jgi:hypothetical protein
MIFPQITYPVVIWGLYAGITAGAIGTAVSRFTAGEAVRALLSEGATSPEDAKTADELGLSAFGRRTLHGSLYGKLFFPANAEDAAIPSKKKRPSYKKPRLDMKKARFYLPKDKEYEALERFPKQSPVSFVIALVLLTAFFTLLHFFLPSLVSLFISAFST